MAVVFDTVGPGASGSLSQGAPPATLTWSHSCSGTNRLLIVGVSFAAGGAYGGTDFGVTLSATYNGIPMVSLGVRHSGEGADGFGQLFYLVNPPAGTYTVSVSQSGWTSNNADILAGSISFSGVSQSTPVQNYASSVGTTSPSSLAVASAAGNMTVALIVSGDAISSDSQTSRILRNLNSSTGAGNISMSTAPGGTSVNFSYTLNTNDWSAVLGVDVIADTSDLTALPWVI